MFIFHIILLTTFSLSILTNPLPQSSENLIDLLSSENEFILEANAECATNDDNYNEPTQKRNLHRRSSICPPDSTTKNQPLNPIEKTPSIQNQRTENDETQPSAPQNNPCIRPLHSFYLVCGGPLIDKPGPNIVLNCVEGKSFPTTWIFTFTRINIPLTLFSTRRLHHPTRQIPRHQKDFRILLRLGSYRRKSLSRFAFSLCVRLLTMLSRTSSKAARVIIWSEGVGLQSGVRSGLSSGRVRVRIMEFCKNTTISA